MGEGNLIELLHKCAPHIGEIQVADVPGRTTRARNGDGAEARSRLSSTSALSQ